MEKKNISAERNREATEKRLLNTLGTMIKESGFEKIGLNAIASRAGVSKILIYRYFGSVEGLIAAYIQKYDFLLNSLSNEFPSREELPAFIKNIFYGQIEDLRKNIISKRLYRWELSSDNEFILKIREQREKTGMDIIRKVCEITGYPQEQVASIASILSASVTYLAMLGEVCPVYNGIALNKDAGWKQVYQGIEKIIDDFFKD
ncbi:MAG: TetR/AcrR family transcriptional regulator [Bacteroides sp.]|nr:TetR/AcrR family transcriptional regulator [Bacteroides sp.]